MRVKGTLPTVENPKHGSADEIPWVTHKEFVLDALNRFEQPLMAYANRLYEGDLHAARDAVQHTFLQLCKQSQETVSHKLGPWLYSVCRNRILDDVRSARRQKSDDLNGFDTIDRRAIDPSVQLETNEFLQTLQKLMECLHQAERDVVELWSHGFDAAEIAEILKRKQGTVRVNLHRAIKRLKQHPQIANWLERATGQTVGSDVNQCENGSTSGCNGTSTPFISGERS